MSEEDAEKAEMRDVFINAHFQKIKDAIIADIFLAYFVYFISYKFNKNLHYMCITRCDIISCCNI